MARSFSFDEEQFNRFFPFYVLIDKDLKIVNSGMSLKKIVPIENGALFNQFFSIPRPLTEIETFKDLVALKNQLVVLSPCSSEKGMMRGQFEYLKNTNEILFVGSPWLDSMEAVIENNLVIDDFAIQDPLIDLLHVLKTVEITNEELRELVSIISNQKNDLKKLSKEYYNIALFPTQNPDPNIRINYKGEIIQNNPAASNLDFIEYEGSNYRIDLFFKLLASGIDKSVKRKSFEIRSNEVDYSLDCVAMPDEGYINIYGRDITEQKINQKELEKLSLIVQETINAVIITDSNGKINWVNRAFEELTGYKLNEVLGKTPGAFLQGEETNSEIVDYMRSEIRDSKPFTCEVLNYKKSGERYWLRINGQPIFDKNGKMTNYFAIEEDITKIKNIQHQIEQSEKKYRDVIDHTLAIVTTHDLEGRLLTVNPMVKKMFGYDEDEVLDRRLIDFMPEDDKIMFYDEYLTKIKQEKEATGIFRILHKNGDIVYSLYNNYLKEEPGKDPYVIGFSVDITTRILAEKELKLAKKKTEELARSKHNFLANMSHEIRTPMNAIMGMSRQLKKTSLNDEQQSYLYNISTASENLLVIINDILDLSKLEANKLSFEKIGFKPKLVIDNALKVMNYKAEEKGIKLTNNFYDTKLSPVLIGDPYRINQILLNIISNAIKFTEVGSVDISCKVLKETDNVQEIEIKITDTGVGMDSLFLEKLFEKFTQEYGAKSKNFGGTGLGMAITKSLINNMGGAIFVESEKNKGTTVFISFPLDKGTELDIEGKDNVVTTSTNLKGKKILVVDDNIMNRMIAALILKEFKVEVSEVGDGEEAVNYLKENQCDLVLMDIQMPVLNGYKATEIIREELKLDLPVIALTANVIEGEREKCIIAGMNDYLSKPFEEEEFIRVICNWVE
ncbi:PAS domain S-box-containing protein [Lutibacter oricola]|uniref:PAS domain S-box-containing protein n=1 Tax=Lutibacter oricola TaxID=762486 RepID=A0A1H2YT46_9FLAO|nr:PAS domain S-box protein [Lutibacter oricola]SDX08350.1 PAS domain S-box-containing protein [Lutibacter oricola]